MAAYVRLLTDWIDGIFGDGACNKLLGHKTSLSNVMSLCDEIGEAAVQQGLSLIHIYHVHGGIPDLPGRAARPR